MDQNINKWNLLLFTYITRVVKWFTQCTCLDLQICLQNTSVQRMYSKRCRTTYMNPRLPSVYILTLIKIRCKAFNGRHYLLKVSVRTWFYIHNKMFHKGYLIREMFQLVFSVPGLVHIVHQMETERRDTMLAS